MIIRYYKNLSEVVLGIRVSLLFIIALFFCSCSKEEKIIIREWKPRLLKEQKAFYDTIGVTESPFFNNLHKLENWVSSNITNSGSVSNGSEFQVEASQSYNINLDSSVVKVSKLTLQGEGFDKCYLTYIEGIGIVAIDYNRQPYYLTNERVILNGKSVKSTDYTRLLEEVLLPDSIEIFNSLDTTKIIEVN